MKRIALFVFALFSIGFCSQAQITSTFDTDADGWTFSNPAGASVTVVYSSTGGNPSGRVLATYSSNTGFATQSWIAPAKFSGNQMAFCLGMNLRFDLQQSQAGTSSNANGDVRIESGNNQILYSLPAKPAVAPGWSSYSLKLDETQGWRVSSTTGPLATRAQIIAALSNITAIEIRGTYATNASYTSSLDNVVLEQRTLTPAPLATSLSATSGKPGDVITITGSGFNTTPSSNSIAFGTLASTKAVVQSATTNQLQVVVPAGASYGPITITNAVTGLSSKTATPFNPVFDGGGRIVPASFLNKFTISTIFREGFFVGDIDGDGWEDFAVANNNADDVIDIYRNLGLGGNLSAASFDTKLSVAIPQVGGSGTNGAGLWFADLDGDGMLDAVSSNATSAISAAFITLRNISTPGNMAFEAPEYWAGGSDETPISLIADLDGDGRPEIMGGESAICGCVRTDFWFNQNISTPGNIEFGSASGLYNNSVINGFGGAQIGDLNGDGKGDLLVSHQGGNRFTVLQNTSIPGVPSFLNSFTFDTDRTMRLVDVNLDGKNDLVWRKSGLLYFRINTDTDGILTINDFATEFILANEIGVDGGISITDFNGDGKPDIAVTDSDAVGVFENIFDGGTFSAASFIPAYQVSGAGAGSSTSSPVVSDLNHDGKPDFLIAGSASITIVENKNVVAPHISLNTVSPLSAPVGGTVTITGNNFSTVLTDNEVWFGDVRASVLTATTTQLTVTVPAGAAYAPVSVRRGEFSSSYHLPFATSFSAGVTFNNTHFAPPVSYTLTGADYDIEVGDLELDGRPDIIAEGSGLISRIFQNTHTTGAISTSSLTVVGTTASSSANPKLTDVDGDGKLDIVSPNGRTYPNQSTTGTISFATEITTATADNIGFGDLNEDGKIDLVSAAPSSGSAQLQLQENRSNVGVFVNSGTYGSFSSNIIYTKASRGGDVTIADFDNDGFNDVVSLNPFTDNLSIFRNAQKFRVSTTLFDSRVDIAVGDNPLRSYPADFDRDGKIDLLVTHWTGTSTTLLIVFQNTSTVGNISFNRIDLTNPSAVTIATVADLDGDGKPEIITTSEAGNRFSIFKNIHTSGALTAASFASPFNTTVTAPRGITTGDLNLDGKPEIILTRAAGLLVVYENLIPSIPPPTITSFNPTFGPVGTTVTITGTNFSTTAANNTVAFNGTTSIVTASTATSITTTVPVGATTGLISVTVGTGTGVSATNFTVTTSPIITITTQPSGFTACVGQTATFTTAASGTTNIIYQWQFSPDGIVPYTDIVNGGGYSNANTATLSINTTGNFGLGRYRCRINGDFAAEVISTNQGLTINPISAAPTVVGANRCGAGSVTLTASGGSNGQYKWYTVASGGTAIAGEVNSTYITPSISSTTSYFVSLTVSSCESARTSVTATINPLPTAPTTTGASACLPSATVTLNATGGSVGQYRWYTVPTGGTAISGQTGSSFTSPALSATTTYYVSIDNGTCESTRTSVVATLLSCTTPPTITTAPLSTSIGGIAELNLVPLISTVNNPLNISSIVVTVQPTSGALASISNGRLFVNYANVSFSGKESVTVRACDNNSNCATQQFEIEVAGDVIVFNALSPNGANPTFVLQYIDIIPETKNNVVTIFDRWQNEVWKGENYNNTSVVFKGVGDGGNDLPTGTYFYKIEFASGNKMKTGFISLKR